MLSSEKRDEIVGWGKNPKFAALPWITPAIHLVVVKADLKVDVNRQVNPERNPRAEEPEGGANGRMLVFSEGVSPDVMDS